MDDHADFVWRIEAVLARISAACIFLASCALVVLVVTFGWLVFGRYVLNMTPTWVEQLALLLVGYIVFLGAAAGVHDDGHLGVTMFRDALGERARMAVLIVADFILAIFGGVMFVAGIELMRFGWDTRLPMLDLPESIRTLSMVCCGGLMVLFAGLRAGCRVWRFPHAVSAPVDEGR